MSATPPEDRGSPAPADDTAAFQRYYLADGRGHEVTDAAHGLLYRVLVGWWRRR
jgi:hypothetical protein